MSGILVINPNSSVAVTAALDRALDPLRVSGGPAISTITLAEGPPGIESQAQVDAASAHVTAAMRREPADAYVIACFSDPGLHAAREQTESPVFGIAESGLTAALALGSRIGIVAILPQSVPRHLRYIDTLGLRTRIAGDRALGIGVAGLADETRTTARLVEVGTLLRDQDGADVLVLGCAGMARYRAALERELAMPVVDPTQAAVGQAITALALGWRHRFHHKQVAEKASNLK